MSPFKITAMDALAAPELRRVVSVAVSIFSRWVVDSLNSANAVEPIEVIRAAIIKNDNKLLVVFDVEKSLGDVVRKAGIVLYLFILFAFFIVSIQVDCTITRCD